MALNPALAGRTYPPVRYEVGREVLRDFARAVGESDPVYHDEVAARAAGYADLPAVPTFPVLLANRAMELVIADTDLGLDFDQVVHGEQEFVYERPVVAGDRLRAVGSLATVRARGGNQMLTVETVVTDADGELVCTARATLVVRAPEPSQETPS